MNSSIPRAQPDTLIQALEEARSRVNQISSGVIEQVVAVRRLEGRPELWIERALCAIGMPARNIWPPRSENGLTRRAQGARFSLFYLLLYELYDISYKKNYYDIS